MNKRVIGDNYEKVAIRYLQSKGYAILETNFHAGRFGEIDIIARDSNGLLIICECKYRKNENCENPLSAVDYKKQRQISRTTLFYYSKNGYGYDYPCRFDVIGIYGNGQIEHIENAFDFIE
jgi:putative endonuclease